jgi:hypothetical protein
MNEPEFDQLVDSLDSSLAEEFIQFRQSIQTAQQLIQRLEAAPQRIQNADAILGEVHAGGAAASDLKALFELLDRLHSAPSRVRQALTLPPEVADQIQSARAAFQNLSTVQTGHIRALQPLADLFRQLKDAGRVSDNLLAFAGGTFQQWLQAQGAEVEVPGAGGLTLRFRGESQGPLFGPNAGLSVDVIYEGGYRIRYGSVRLRYKPNDQDGTFTVSPVIDFAQPPQLDLSGVANNLLAAAFQRVSLPAPVSMEPPQLDFGRTPPEVTVAAKFSGIGPYNGLQFEAKLRIPARGDVRAEGAAELVIPAVIPIGTTPLFFNGLSMRYVTETRSLAFGTKITLGNAPPQQTPHFDVKVIMKITDLANGVTLDGTFVLVGGAGVGKVVGNIRPNEIDATLTIPHPPNSTFPLPKSVLSVNAKAHLDQQGLRADGEVVYFSRARGTMDVFIAPDGSGRAVAKANIAVLGVQGAVSAVFGRQFQNPVVTATASVRVPIPGFKPISASVTAEARGTGAVQVQAKALGQSLPPFSLPGLDSDVLAELRDRLAGQATALAERVWEQANDFLSRFEEFNRKAAIRLAVASLGLFTGASVEGARQAVTQIRDAFGDAFDRFGVQIGDVLSIDRWLSPFRSESVTQTGSPAAITPADVEARNRTVLAFSQALDARDLKVSQSLGVGTPPERDERVDSEIDLRFDQVTGAIVHLTDASITSAVTFLVAGSTFARRVSRSREASHSEWGSVVVFNVEPLGSFARITIPLLANDASILHARRRVYRVVREFLEEHWPGIHYGDPIGPESQLNIDPNDPGPPPPPDPTLFPPQPAGTGSGGQQGDDEGTPINPPDPGDPGTPIDGGSGGDDQGIPIDPHGNTDDSGTGLNGSLNLE